MGMLPEAIQRSTRTAVKAVNERHMKPRLKALASLFLEWCELNNVWSSHIEGFSNRRFLEMRTMSQANDKRPSVRLKAKRMVVKGSAL